MPTVHKIARLHIKGQRTGKRGRPQLYDYPFASLRVGDTFRVRAAHLGRVKMHRFMCQRVGLGTFSITRTTPAGRTYTVRRTR